MRKENIAITSVDRTIYRYVKRSYTTKELIKAYIPLHLRNTTLLR